MTVHTNTHIKFHVFFVKGKIMNSYFTYISFIYTKPDRTAVKRQGTSSQILRPGRCDIEEVNERPVFTLYGDSDFVLFH